MESSLLKKSSVLLRAAIKAIVLLGGFLIPSVSAEAWTGTDIGSVGVAGTDSYNASTGVYTIQGSGADIGSTADACHFVYQSLTADGELEARVATVQNTNAAAKAGVMIRQTTAAGSIEAMISVAPASSVTFLNRTATGGSTTSTSVGTTSPPCWVKIDKDGTLISVYQSTNGTTWNYEGLVRLTSLTNPVDIGFAVTSHSNTVLCTATFDNIYFSSQTSYAPTSPWHDQDIGTTGQTGAIHLENAGWSIFGAGSGITGTADSFHFGYEAFTGNASISARVDGISATAGSAGVVIRQDLTAGSAEAAVLLKGTSTTGVSFLSRTSSGGTVATTAGAKVSAPYWVKLVRLGNVFYAYQSTDGSTWTAVGNQTVTMTGTVYVGLATTSASTSALALGVLDRVAALPPDTYLTTGDIAAGANHDLYLQSNGTMSAWGLNTNGQVGDGTTTTRTAPVSLTTLSGMEAISGGASHSVALKNDGTVWVWGLNTNGQLGDGSTTQHTSPEQLTTLSGIVSVSAGASHSIALKNDGTVWVWGLNTNGQLGDGTTTQHTSPEQLTTLSGIVAISAGGSHSLALKNDGTVWAWGLNSTGQIGDGTTTQRTAPVKLTGVSNIIAISAGTSHSLAIDDDGNVWSWGDNSSGEIGDGTTTERNSPVELTSLTGLTGIKASNLFSVALRSDGTVWAWGKNSSGQLGNNTTTQANSPVQASGLTGAVSISAGTSHTMAITSDDGIWAWGSNANGQFGNNTTTSSLIPVSLKPSITSSASASGTTGVAFTYTITATSNPKSFNATGLPAGLSVNTSTGVISGTPTTVGTSTVTLSATNISGTGTGVLNLTINPPAPVISSAATASGTTGTAFSYTITASNSPTSYNATGLPAGLSINTSTGVISGTPTATGTFPVALSATNAGGTGTKTLTLTIIPPPPVITSAASATGNTGTPFSYTITASNSPTSYNATGLPAGLSVNTTTGVISGTPSATGTSSVSLSATNAGGTGTKTLSLTINIPAPVITSATTASGTTGVAFSYTITASNTPTSYNATGLPSGLTVATTTGKITGTPTAVGTSSVTISATNAGGTGSATLTLTINPPAPAISSAATATGTVGSTFSYTITASNSPTSFNATNLPAGLSVNTTTGLISGTPSASGTASVLLSATNAGGTGTETLTLTINLAPPVISNAATASGTQGTPFSLNITASNSPTGYGATGLPAGLSVNSTTGLISGTPSATGTSNVTLSATNTAGTGTKALSLTINPPPPVMTSPTTVNGLVGVAFSYQIAATNSPTGFNATGLPSGLSVNTSTGVISGTLSAAGATTVTISATNASGTTNQSLILTAYNPGSLTVTSGLTAWLKADTSVQNDGSGKAQQWNDLTCNENNAAQSSSGNRPTVSAGAIQGNAVMHFDGSSTYLDMPRCIQNDFSIVVVFRSSTGSGGGGSWYNAGGIVDAEVNGVVNDFGTSLDQNGNVLTGIGNPDTTISSLRSGYNNGQPHILTFTRAQTSGVFTQYVDSVLQSTASGNTGPLTSPTQIAIGATQTLANYFGGDVAEVLIYNRVISSADRFQIETYLGNKYGVTPAVSGAASGFQGASFSYQVVATDGPTAYAASGLPSGLTINTSTGVISGTPTVTGTFPVAVTASNSGGSGTGTVTITLYGDNPPSITTNVLYGTVGQPLSAQINATNLPSSYGVTGLPSGLSVNSATGAISGTPSATGTYTLTLSATNPYGTTNASTTLNIRAVPQLGSTTGLVAWFKADAGVTADSNGNVSTWADQMGNYSVSQTSSTNEPSVVTNDLNGEPSLRFNGSQWLNNSGNMSLNAGMTMIVVSQSTNPSQNQYSLYCGGLSGGQGRSIFYYNSYDYFDDYGTGCYGEPVPSANTFVTETTTLDPTRSVVTFFRNGIQQASSSVSGVSNMGAGVTVGAYPTGGGGWKGDIAEVLVYDHQLSSSELQTVGVYLADKYGLYNPNATWPQAYSAAVQAQITANKWNRAQADVYAAFLATSPPVPAPGLSLWLKADAGITSDFSGNISQWVDQGPNAFTATQSNISADPVVVSNAINGKPVLQFSGSQFLQGSGNLNISAAQGVTIIALDTTTAPGDQRYLITAGGSSSSGQTRNMGYEYGEQTLSTTNHDIGGGAVAPPGSGIYVVDAVTLATDGSDITFYRNGVQTGTATTSGTGDVNAGFFVGSYVGGLNWKGTIGEVLVYNRVLSSAEMTQAMAYLADKYGLYNPNATWILAYSPAVQAEIAGHGWNKAQANAYVAMLATNPDIPTSGLSIWLKADAGVTADGSNNVTSWTEQASGLTATQNSSAAPTFVSNSLNGKPGIVFNGSNRLSSTGYVPLDGSFTMISVCSSNDTGSERYMIGVGNLVSSLDCRGFGNANGVFALGVDNAYTSEGQFLNSGESNIVDVEYAKGTSTATFYARGSLVASGGVSTGATSGGFNVGDISNGNYPRMWDGAINEIIVYNRALTDAERGQVEGYLADKYGLYNPNATWPLAYSADVQAQITAYQWNKAQADVYAAFVAANPSILTSGLNLWFRADAGVTTDGSGNVSQWKDQSYNGFVGTQTNSSNEPTTVTDSTTGLPAVHFNGSQWVSGQNYVPVNGDVTIVTVAEDDNPSNFGIVGGVGYNPGPNGSVRAVGYRSNQPEFDVWQSSGQAGTATFTGTHISTTTYARGTGQVNFYTDGSLNGQSSTSCSNLISGFIVGGGPWNSAYWTGTISEVLVYNHVLSTAEQRQIEGYLADKYGLYDPSATWPNAYSAPVQALIAAGHWNKSDADAYVALGSSSLPSTGLSLWLKADVGVTSDGSGNVSAWQDQSSNGNNLVQSSASSEPVLSSIGSQPYIYFDQLGRYLQASADSSTLKPVSGVTIFAVHLPQNAQNASADLISKAFNNTGWPPNVSYGLRSEGGQTMSSYLNSGSEGGAESAANDAGRLQITSSVYNGTELNLYDDGLLAASEAQTGSISYDSSDSPIVIGGTHAGSANYNWWKGYVGEILIYNRALSVAEKTQVEVYLANKYGVYDPGATWPQSYSAAVQAEITRNRWSKAQADAYVAMQAANPAMLTNGLSLWIRADAGVTSSGGLVSQVVDQTGNFVLTQSNGSNQPTLVTSAVNGLPALRFAGSQWLASNQALGYLGADMTIIAVQRNANATGNGYSLYLGAPGTSAVDRGLGTYVNESFDASGTSAYGGISPTNGNYFTETATLNPTLSNVSFYENGVSTGSGTSSGSAGFSAGITLGASAGGTNGWTGDLVEELVYDHQLSASELQQVGAYLSSKYNLPLFGAAPVISPAGGSFSSTEPVAITSNYPGGTVHYTLDGTAPSASSPTYSSPISLTASALVSAAVFTSSGQEVSQIATEQFYINDPTDSGLPRGATGLNVTTTSGQASLSWTLSGLVNYTGVEIYRSSDGGSTYQLIASLASSATSYTDSDVQSGTTYQYRVTTYNTSGETNSSSSSSTQPSASSLTITLTAPSGAVSLP